MTGGDKIVDAVTSTRLGAVAVISMNRPRHLNVLGIELLGALNNALVAAAGDPLIGAVVLKGEGRSFSAGGDLSALHADPRQAPEVAEQMVGRFHACIRAIRDMPKPVIAALHGPIAGGGFSLAIACDLAVAAEDATFLSAYTRLGTNPDGGGTWSLTRLLGLRRALELILLNEPISGQRACELGLVNRVVPGDLLERTVCDMAAALAAGSASANAAVKRLVNLAVTSGLDEQLDREKAGFVAAAGTADFHEGVSAFFERRPARFRR